MAISPNDFHLTAQQLRDKYTISEIQQTKRLLEAHGESKYKSNYLDIIKKDPVISSLK